MTEIVKRDRGAHCQTEWKRWDLLLTTGGKSFVVEFKVYAYNREYDLDGNPGSWKGYPSLKNEGEFRKCVNKLRAFEDSRIAGKYLVLVYQKGCKGNRKASYEQSYADLTRFDVTMVEEIEHCYENYVACKLITIQSERD